MLESVSHIRTSGLLVHRHHPFHIGSYLHRSRHILVEDLATQSIPET